jgi:hypothetical protein
MPVQFSTRDSAGATLQAAVEFQYYLIFFVQGINMGRTNIETYSFLATLAFLRIDLNVPFRIGLNGILGQFCFDVQFHRYILLKAL